MNRYKLHICFASVLVAVGLAFGADAYSQGTVSVLLPPSMASPLSVNNEGAQAALQTANSVLAPAGFVGGQVITPNVHATGQLAVFTRDISVGSPTVCNVVVRNGQVVFSFIETGIPYSSSAKAELCNELAGALRDRFGAASVEVRLK